MIEIPDYADCRCAQAEMRRVVELVDSDIRVRERVALLANEGIEPYELVNGPGGLSVFLSEPYWRILEEASWPS